MALKKKPVTGMKDILPGEMEIRDYVLNIIKDTYRGYGFSAIETPCVEHIENLTSKQGGDNEKLIFKILKRGEKLNVEAAQTEADVVDGGLRYDLTLPLSRYYANNSANLSAPFKALQVGSVWRADRPQKGRFRQFVQCDIDILGDATNLAEIEEILALTKALKRICPDKAYTVRVNDRAILKGMADYSGFPENETDKVFIILDKMDKIGLDGVREELLAEGYAPEAVEKYTGLLAEIQNDAAGVRALGEKLSGVMDPAKAENLATIMETVKAVADIEFGLEFDPTLVRGMGYYTGTIFEIKSDDFKGSSIAGGGRYDNMIGSFTGTPTCACGFSIGFERLVGALLDKKFRAEGGREKVAVLYGKAFAAADVAALQCRCNALRESGKIVLCQRMNKNLGFQKQKLEAQGYTVFVDVRTPEEVADKLADRT